MILLYGESLKKGSSFRSVNQLINSHFNSPEDAVRLKTEVFTDNKLFNFDRHDILSYLYSNNYDPKFLEHFNLSQLLLDAYKDREIDINELAELYLRAPTELLSERLLDNIDIDDDELLYLIAKYDRLINPFGGRLRALAIKEQTWEQSFDFQVKLLRALEETENVNWHAVLSAILLSKSEIIFDALKQNYQRIFFALRWMDEHNYAVLKKLEDRIFVDFKRPFIDFIRNDSSLIRARTCEKVFKNLNFSEINSIGFDAAKWLNVYHKITDENTRIFASCVLLSFGFNRKVGNPAGLVVGCFSDVYYFAKAAKVSGNDWQVLPVDMSEEEDYNKDPLTSFFNFINLFSPQKKDVPNWDYCELLIRTLVNKFIKYSWPNQAFVETLTTEHLTHQAIRYCLSFKKGVKFLKSLLSDIEKRKVNLRKHQSNFISQISAGLINS